MLADIPGRDMAWNKFPFARNFRARAASEDIPLFSGFAGVGIGVAVLLGWAIDSEPLKRVVPGFVAMNPATAAGILLLGACLVLRGDMPSNRWFNRIAGLGIFTAALVCLADMVFRFGIGIDSFLFSTKLASADTANTNPMAPNTALSLMLLGLTAALFAHRRRTSMIVGQLFAVVVIIIALIAVLGYLSRTIGLYKFGEYFPMAMNTAVSLLILSGGFLWVHPREGAMAKHLYQDGKGKSDLPMNARVLTAAFAVLLVIIIAGLWGGSAD